MRSNVGSLIERDSRDSVVLGAIAATNSGAMAERVFAAVANPCSCDDSVMIFRRMSIEIMGFNVLGLRFVNRQNPH